MKSNLLLFKGIIVTTLLFTAKIQGQNSQPSSIVQNQTIESFDKLYEDFRQQQLINGISEVIYEGSPYLSNNSSNNALVYNQNKISDLILRYNIYNDIMEVEKEGQFYQIPKSNLFSDFTIDEHHFKLISYFNGEKQKNGYLEVLSDTNKISLFKKHQITLLKAEKPGAYKDAQPARFKPSNPIYYISVNDNDLVPCKSENELFELFPQYKSQLKIYLKKNKLKFRNEMDIVKTIIYLDSIYNE